ncbi:MAG: hypothetical protein MK081_03550 [Flavobacteriales bacterium]|nr:hypothetical protein [Flavobacteriales bacterium]
MQDFTLDDLSHFAKHERRLIQEIFNIEDTVDKQEVVSGPSDESISRIIAYNKALSVRKGTKIKHYQLLLN